ncbi:MAG: DUF3040 domain-containing protein [Acidobacteria bacterium]|nr:DUF3040 domain-containing protein [Acidobacteriota bacterium]
MPLSEHEQRILDEIERRLAADDPKFARHARASKDRVSKRLRLSAVAFGAGLALLIAALFIQGATVPLGLVAFGVMLFAVVVGTATLKHLDRERPPVALPQPPAWFARLEERWRKRFERGDGR